MKNKKIMELEREIRHLRKLIIKDELTNVLNRRGFYEKISEIFNDVLFIKRDEKSRSRYGRRKKFLINDLSLLFLDVDGLKKINDIYGHRDGDKIIRIISEITQKIIRETDFVGRWGGDEFLVALVGSSESDAHKIAENIRKAVKNSKKIAVYKSSKISLSIGIAEVDENLLSVDDLIEMADKAMYEAKNRRGKDNAIKYSEIKGA